MLRYIFAVWSIMLVNGTTNITRLSSCFNEWRSAKEREDRVLPPPVGTVSEKNPLGNEETSRQFSRTRLRRRLTGVESLLLFPFRFLSRRSESTLRSAVGMSRSQSWKNDSVSR